MNSGNYVRNSSGIVGQTFQSASKRRNDPPGKKLSPFSIRLTEEERKYLDEHFGSQSWAAYIRFCVFGDGSKRGKSVRRPRLEDPVLAYLINLRSVKKWSGFSFEGKIGGKNKFRN